MQIQIEYPSEGATYSRDQYGVYRYDTYPRSSVLAGQERRVFLDSFNTLEEAQAAYPGVPFINNSCYTEPHLDHLSDEGDYQYG
jgi:hypothetical protein